MRSKLSTVLFLIFCLFLNELQCTVYTIDRDPLVPASGSVCLAVPDSPVRVTNLAYVAYWKQEESFNALNVGVLDTLEEGWTVVPIDFFPMEITKVGKVQIVSDVSGNVVIAAQTQNQTATDFQIHLYYLPGNITQTQKIGTFTSTDVFSLASSKNTDGTTHFALATIQEASGEQYLQVYTAFVDSSTPVPTFEPITAAAVAFYYNTFKAVDIAIDATSTNIGIAMAATYEASTDLNEISNLASFFTSFAIGETAVWKESDQNTAVIIPYENIFPKAVLKVLDDDSYQALTTWTTSAGGKFFLAAMLYADGWGDPVLSGALTLSSASIKYNQPAVALNSSSSNMDANVVYLDVSGEIVNLVVYQLTVSNSVLSISSPSAPIPNMGALYPLNGNPAAVFDHGGDFILVWQALVTQAPSVYQFQILEIRQPDTTITIPSTNPTTTNVNCVRPEAGIAANGRLFIIWFGNLQKGTPDTYQTLFSFNS